MSTTAHVRNRPTGCPHAVDSVSIRYGAVEESLCLDVRQSCRRTEDDKTDYAVDFYHASGCGKQREYFTDRPRAIAQLTAVAKFSTKPAPPTSIRGANTSRLAAELRIAQANLD